MNYSKTWAQIEKEKKQDEACTRSGTETLGAFAAFVIIIFACLIKG